MPTLYILIGNAKKPNLKEHDKLLVLDISKFNLSDIPYLFKMISGDPKDVADNAKKLFGIDASELMKYDQIKICLDKSIVGIVKRAVGKKVSELGYDLFDCH